MSDRIFLDTNILVYAYDLAEPKKQLLAQELIETLLGEERGYVSTQVLAEFYTIVTRKIAKPLGLSEAKNLVEILSNLNVQDIKLEILKNAISIHHKYKISFWDGQIIASALSSKCKIIYSEDLSSGQQYEGIIVSNPFV